VRVRPRTPPLDTPPETPNLSEESAFAAQGFRRIAGIDEAGRGSWAGPLVAAAVCLPCPDERLLGLLAGVRDSKQLTSLARSRLYRIVLERAVDVGIGVVSPTRIDSLGLSLAGELAMRWAVEDMTNSPDCLLLDAFSIRGCPLPQRALIRGDQRSLSIAAASIVAKVTRDRIMRAAHSVYPGYALSCNKGYGTRMHRWAVSQIGPCEYHRRSFSPIRELERGGDGQ
jgi:ribonuclease HII